MSLSNVVWRCGRVRAAGAVALGIALSAGGLAQGAQDFKGLGQLPGGSGSMATGISADGGVVVGVAFNAVNQRHAFRWTPGDGMVDLGTFRDGRFTFATGVSADGSVVAGFGDVSGGEVHAFRWTSTEGIRDLGVLDNGTIAQAFAVSGTGKVVVGMSGHSDSFKAFRWTEQTGIQSLGTLGTDPASFAEAANEDGTVIVGMSGDVSGAVGHAFRWSATGAGAMKDLGLLPGGSFSTGHGVSADGSVVIGIADSLEGVRAFRWTVQGGMKSLGVLAGASNSIGLCVDTSGEMIAGASLLSEVKQHAFLWRQTTGMQDVNTLLARGGANLQGWELNEVRGVGNGQVMAGSGIHDGIQEAWIASVPSACGSADFDCDGDVGTDADIQAFFACLAGDCPQGSCTSTADMDGDGDVGTDADIEAFFRVLAGGSC